MIVDDTRIYGSRVHEDIEIQESATNSIKLSKKAFSTEPCFYLIKDAVVHLSDSWRELAKGCDPEPDYYYDYLRYQAPLTRKTAAKGVFLLRAGEKIRVEEGKLIEEEELNPYPEGEIAISAQEFHSILLSDLSKLAGLKTSFHLSAGLDSSLLLILGSELLRIEDILAVSCRTLGRGASEELDIASRIADELKVEFRVFDFSDIDIFSIGKDFLKYGPGYPIAHPSHIVRFLLDYEISKTTYKNIVVGRGPDEVLGGYRWLSDESAIFQVHHGFVESTSPELMNQLFIESVTGDAFCNYQKHFSEGYSLSARAAYDTLTLFEGWNLIDSALEKNLGVQYAQPFLHPRILGGCVALPDSYKKFVPPRGKTFLLESFDRYYPDYLKNIPKQGLSFDASAYFRCFSHKDIMDKLYSDSPFNKKYLDKGTLGRMIETTLAGTVNYGWQLWSIYMIHLTTLSQQSASTH